MSRSSIALARSAPAYDEKPAPARRPRALLDAGALSARLGEEAERARRYGRPLAVLYVDLVSREASSELLREALSEAVRSVDVAGLVPAGLIVLLPETAYTATVPARRLVDALAARGISSRIGIALCPAHASAPEGLFELGKATATRAGEGTVALAGEREPTLAVGDSSVIAADPRMQRLFDLLRRLATSDIPVLIAGETGVGKETIARALRAWSPRGAGPFVSINCAALTDALFESELFGHEKGPFSGAARAGLLEAASGGILFLDEVGDCSLVTQAKLLRVLETRCLPRAGSGPGRPLDVRILSGTSRDLAQEAQAGRFRRDLFYRLNAATVQVPSLRERPLDVPLLAQTFLAEACAKLGRKTMGMGPAALACLGAYAWPGNVRELRNAMEYVAATADEDTLDLGHLPLSMTSARPAESRAAEPATSLQDEIRDLERRRIGEALEACGGVRVRAAERLRIPLRSLSAKIKACGLADVATRRET